MIYNKLDLRRQGERQGHQMRAYCNIQIETAFHEIGTVSQVGLIECQVEPTDILQVELT